jgi:hypothetical protein
LWSSGRKQAFTRYVCHLLSKSFYSWIFYKWQFHNLNLKESFMSFIQVLADMGQCFSPCLALGCFHLLAIML